VRAFGPAARVELEGTDSASGQQFEVELTHERASELHLREGEAVRLVPSRLKLFECDGAESAR
jgi:sulfate transport system ATP-binding protein